MKCLVFWGLVAVALWFGWQYWQKHKGAMHG